MARKTHTSTEVKQRWESKAYSKYLVRLRHDMDRELIDMVERRKKNGEQTTEIFREALEALLQSENE